MASAPAAHLHLGHEQRTSGSGGTHPHLHPVKQEVQADIPLAGAREVEEAVAKAAAAQDDWRRTPPEARRDILNRLADLLEAHRTRLAEMRSEEHTSELQSIMRISYAVFCLKKKKEQCTNYTNDSKS